MSEATLYSACVASGADDLLECISDGLEQSVASVSSGVDSFYLIFAGALVYFMQTGFAMLCAGSIRSKNVKNILLWNLLDSVGGCLAFWSVGYAFAYGGDDAARGTTFIGNTNFFLLGDVDMEQFFFQFAFTCALSSIVAGTIAERCKMTAYLFYSTFLAAFLYPVVAHSFWSVNGFLSNTNENPLWGSGAVDLAGSGPVHMTGGVVALVMAVILGPRLGRFYDENGNPYDEPREIEGHSVVLQFLGTFCLWFGWYGFNPGGTLFIASTELGDVASLAAVNTSIGAASGAFSALFTHTIIDERRTGLVTYDLTSTMNGCLTGLVAITAPCATVEPWAAFVIGIVAGWVYLFASSLLLKFKIDDAVDAIPVHFGGGMWGLLSTGLFSAPRRLESAFGLTKHVGWFYSWGRGSGDFTLLGIQIIAVIWIIGWVVGIMGPYIYFLNWMDMLRVDPLEEEVGGDISRHKGPAYVIEDVSKEKQEELSLHRSQHKKKKKKEKAADADDA
jgi:Amt family ammonium transporter